MNEDRLNELLEQCQSPIECELLQNLYPHLTTVRARELRLQHKIDRYDDMQVTIPDFAFPDMQIAIYCDGYGWHSDRVSFGKDRLQSRELQLRGWIVLRFAVSEINDDGEMVVDTVRRAIARRDRQRKWGRLPLHLGRQTQQKPRTKRDKQLDLELHSGRQTPWTQKKPEGGMCGVIVLACVIVGIVVLLNFIF